MSFSRAIGAGQLVPRSEFCLTLVPTRVLSVFSFLLQLGSIVKLSKRFCFGWNMTPASNYCSNIGYYRYDWDD